jgi:dihydroflavonol-4-reductase
MEKMLLEDYQIVALMRKSTEIRHPRIRTITGDIRNPRSYAQAVCGCDELFHCAACISFDQKDFQKSIQVNVEGTRNILAAAYEGGVRKVVHLSACAVLGLSESSNRLIDETADPEIGKDNIYAYTKKRAEQSVRDYVEKGMDISIANIATVYGPGDKRLNSGAVIKSIYRGNLHFLPPGGTSFVSVEDLVSGIMLAAKKGRTGERYIFCTENMTYATLGRRIAGALGVRAPKYVLPNFSYYPAKAAVKGLSLLRQFRDDRINILSTQILQESYGYKFYSSDKARKELGWKPKQTLEAAVEEAFRYYLANNLL